MTKGKKWTLRLLGVAALALLICLCLLGSTMARYTSTGNGEGTLTVALWDLETASVNIGTDDVVKISPLQTEYDSESARVNDCGAVKALSMVNYSDVAAKVTLELATPEEDDTLSTGLDSGITLTAANNFTWGTGWTDGQEGVGRNQTNKYGADLMSKFGNDTEGEAAFLEIVNAYGVIALTLTDAETEGKAIDPDNPIYLNAYNDSSNSRTWTQDIYADVVWTSICEKDATAELKALVPDGFYEDSSQTGEIYYETIQWAEFSDAVDTILGMYYTTISFSVTWTAVQDSIQPTTP